MKNILKNLIAPTPATAIADAESQLSSIEAARVDIQQRREGALISGDMAAAERADAELSGSDAAAGRLRDRIALLHRAAADAAEAERQEQRQARRQLATDGLKAARLLLVKWDKEAAPRLASALRQFAAAEAFAGDVSRETGEPIPGLYSGMAIPARYKETRRAWWVARDRDGKIVRATNPVHLPGENPKPMNEPQIGIDDKGRPVFAAWFPHEDTIETMASPSIPPGFVHETALLPALMPGAAAHWDEDIRRAAEADAEAIVRQLLNR